MKVYKLINKVFQYLGMEIKRFPNIQVRRRMSLLKHFDINLVLDIGANKGQYGSDLLKFGYSGKIISFEPLSTAYKDLSNTSMKTNNRWISHNIAIGNEDGEIEINVANNSFSSSILPMLEKHIENAPGSDYIGKETVTINKLDTLIPGFLTTIDRIFMKIDTQGYEKNVLEGIKNNIDKIIGIELEMSLTKLYESNFLFQDVIDYMQSNGFTLYGIEEEFTAPKTGQLLQANGIFFRNEYNTNY